MKLKRSKIAYTKDGRPYNTGQPALTTATDILSIVGFLVLLTTIGRLLS